MLLKLLYKHIFVSTTDGAIGQGETLPWAEDFCAIFVGELAPPRPLKCEAFLSSCFALWCWLVEIFFVGELAPLRYLIICTFLVEKKRVVFYALLACVSGGLHVKQLLILPGDGRRGCFMCEVIDG